jgi:hypothetical protein
LIDFAKALGAGSLPGEFDAEASSSAIIQLLSGLGFERSKRREK